MQARIWYHNESRGKSCKYTCVIITASNSSKRMFWHKAINSPGPGCNLAEETARGGAWSITLQAGSGLCLKYILSCESRKLPLLHCYVQTAPQLHIPLSPAECSAGSKLREKRQLRWKECPDSLWPEISSCSTSVFSGPSFLSSKMMKQDCWPGLQGLLQPSFQPHRIEWRLLLSLTIILANII